MWLSPHFHQYEFACPHEGCGHTSAVDHRLIVALEALRSKLGEPIRISSGFRCKAYNSELPGASEISQHTLGRAADIHLPENYSCEEVLEFLKDIPDVRGVGFYDRHIHIDVRLGRGLTVWDKRGSGYAQG